MKRFSIITVLLSIASLAHGQEEDIRYFSPDFSFEKGSVELMYGNNVVLRSEQKQESKALDTLRIGDPVTIIEKGTTVADLNGQPSYWYKVKNKKKVGYVLGGWIALDHKEFNNKTYLWIFAQRDDQLYVRTRVVAKDKSYYGHEISMGTYLASAEVKGNEGLTGVEAIVVVSMHAEACGVVGGDAFLFDNGERIEEVIRTSNMSEAGLFWFSEHVEFKGDNYWDENTVYFSRENGEYMDDSMDWTQKVVNTIKLTWTGEKFTPDIDELTFEVDEE